MKIYAVGGQVRDQLMGVTPKDRDYVVVGATHDQMIAMGYTQVGASFPVYLHPETKEEYALARTERSTGPGYHDFSVDFSPSVTIEEDLKRRDLTMNAVAFDMLTGDYVDPYGGIDDIKNKVLRVVNDEAFLEDPLRIYRLGRFYARYKGEFQIEDKTMSLATEGAGILASLPKERKFAEISKSFDDLGAKHSLFIDFLVTMGEFPELDALKTVEQPPLHHPEGDAYTHTLLSLDYASGLLSSGKVKWAVLLHDLGKVCFHTIGVLHGHEDFGVPLVEEVCQRFGAPRSWTKLATLVCKNHTRLHKIKELSPRKVYDLIKELDGEKSFSNAFDFSEACLCDARGRGPVKFFEDYPQQKFLHEIIAFLMSNREEISKGCSAISEYFSERKSLIPVEVRALKVGYVRKAIKGLK